MVAISTGQPPVCRWYEPYQFRSLRRHWRLQGMRRRGKRLVFIAGCARSGTTLLKQLMAVFHDTSVFPRERTAWHFLDMAGAEESTLVVKRTAECHRGLHQLPAEVDLVYCVRHPYDCLTSSHPLTSHLRRYHVTRDRWFAEYDALRRLRRRQPDRRITVVRYEDLVTKPDGVQADLAGHLALAGRHSFSRNPLGIDIHPGSLEKWRGRPELREHLAASIDDGWLAAIGRFCDEFAYGPPPMLP